MDVSDDLTTHIKKMRSLYKHFVSLISDEHPLQPDDIFAASLIILLPPDLLPVVRPLMSNLSTTSDDVIHALTQDNTFAKTRREVETSETIASQAKAKSQRSSKHSSSTNNNPDLHCSFCKRDGHDLEQCYTARKILEDNRGRQTRDRRDRQMTSKKSGGSARASKVETTTIGDVSEDAEGDESDASSTVIFAKSPSTALSKVAKGRDANVDSGCSQSMTPHADQIGHALPNATTVRLANNSVIKATHSGSLKMPVVPGLSHQSLLVPNLREPLLSVAGLADDGLVLVFDNAGVSFYDECTFKTDTPAVGYGERRGNLYYLPEEASFASLSSVSTRIDKSLFDWHVIFNHIGLKTLKLTLKLLGIKVNLQNEIEVQQCSTCVQSKMSRSPFSTRSFHRASKRGQIIHSDVCSFEVPSREGFNMWATFIDDFSKDIAVYPIKSKDQTFKSFKHFRAAFEKQSECNILSLVSDNGGEYMGNDFQTHLRDVGIHHEPGPPHSPQLNGVAERANRTLCDRLCCCLIGADLPKSFWTDALRHLTFAMNSIPCRTPSCLGSPNSINGIPLVDSSLLHPFGCLVWYKVPDATRKKLDPKGRASMLLSYLSGGNGY